MSTTNRVALKEFTHKCMFKGIAYANQTLRERATEPSHVGFVSRFGAVEVRRDLLTAIGERLARVRGHASQAEFAPVMGVHKNTVGTYERGEREIGAEALEALVREGWNANWLLTGEGPERQTDAQPAPDGAQQLDQATLAHAISILLGVLDENGSDLSHADFGAAVLDIYAAMHTGGRYSLARAITNATRHAHKKKE